MPDPHWSQVVADAELVAWWVGVAILTLLFAVLLIAGRHITRRQTLNAYRLPPPDDRRVYERIRVPYDWERDG